MIHPPPVPPPAPKQTPSGHKQLTNIDTPQCTNKVKHLVVSSGISNWNIRHIAPYQMLLFTYKLQMQKMTFLNYARISDKIESISTTTYLNKLE